MVITKQTVAAKIAAYLRHDISLAELVNWAEEAMMEGELAERDITAISDVVARLGVADMRAFGLAMASVSHYTLYGKVVGAPGLTLGVAYSLAPAWRLMSTYTHFFQWGLDDVRFFVENESSLAVLLSRNHELRVSWEQTGIERAGTLVYSRYF